MNWIIYIAIALTGAGTSLGMDAVTPGCGAGVSSQDITRSVPALEAHLRTSLAFQTDAEALARRTVGQILGTNPDLRDEILGAYASSPCQAAYACEQRATINRHLENLLPRTKFSSVELRNQLQGFAASKGIVLVFHQKQRFQEITARHLSRLGEIPRVAVADEHDQVSEVLMPQLSKILYSRSAFPEGGWQILPSGESYDVYILGGYFSASGIYQIAESFKALFENETIRQLNFHVFTDAAYVNAPYRQVVTYETMYTLTDFDFLTAARAVARPFNLKSEDETVLANARYSYLRQSDGKIVTVSFIRPAL